MSKRFTLTTTIMILCNIIMLAQSSRSDFKKNKDVFGDNYAAYQVPEKHLTDAPKGYEVCYMSHYGRHGSRYLIGKKAYVNGMETLKKADEAGALTPLGKQLLSTLAVLRADAKGHEDELTPLGAQQHRGIAHRMYENFPTLFTKDGKIEARSSTVIRCILSMANEMAELQGLSPELTIDMDASASDMDYIVYDDKDLKKQRRPKGSPADSALNAFRDRHFDGTRFLNSIFTSEDYWRKEIRNPYRFVVDDIWKIVANLQSTEMRHKFSLYDYFTDEELYNIWLVRNAEWYIDYSACPLNGGNQIYLQRNLIRNIISEADSCLALIENADVDATTGATSQQQAPATPKPVTASMRFGHEIVVMPMVCFLNLNGYGKQYSDLEDLEEKEWYSYRIFPMASNIQILFYRKQGSPVLVKFLLNEQEATIPDLEPASTLYYYKWDEVKKYCQDKLDKFSK